MEYIEYLEYIIIALIIIVIGCIVYKFYINDNRNAIRREIANIPDIRNMTIPGVLKWVSEKYPDRSALMIRKDLNWISISYKDYYEQVILFANSLNYWVGHGINVAIMGFNSPARNYAHIGTILNGGHIVNLNMNDTMQAMEFIIRDANIGVVVVENDEHLDKISSSPEIMKFVKLILYYAPLVRGIPHGVDVPVISYGVFVESYEGDGVLDDSNNASNIAYITYNCDKKGEVSSDHILNSVYSCIIKLSDFSTMDGVSLGEHILSYLPNMEFLDIYAAISIVGTVWFADKYAIKNSMIETLVEIRPTLFYGVPRVWEKIREKYNPNILLKYTLSKNIGLDRCKYIFTSGFISNDIREYFDDANIRLYDVCIFNGVPISVSFPGMYMKNSVGIAVNKNVKIVDGDIMFNGQCIGHRGHLNGNFIFIENMQSENITTSYNQTYSPSVIENKIMSMFELQNVVLIGDGRKFLALLIVFAPESDKLISADMIKFFESCGIKKWQILHDQFKVGDELTSTFELRRQYINVKYKEHINKIYNDSFSI